MKKLILTLLVLLCGSLLWAQTGNESGDKRPVNNLNLTFLGNASLISLNYEYLHFAKPNFFMAYNLGLGYDESLNLCFWGTCSSPSSYLTLPHYVTGNIGKGRNFFEFGLGGTVILGDAQQNYYFYPIVGYRLLPLRTNKLYFRVFGQIPVTGLENMDAIFFPFGLSLGIGL